MNKSVAIVSVVGGVLAASVVSGVAGVKYYLERVPRIHPVNGVEAQVGEELALSDIAVVKGAGEMRLYLAAPTELARIGDDEQSLMLPGRGSVEVGILAIGDVSEVVTQTATVRVR